MKRIWIVLPALFVVTQSVALANTTSPLRVVNGNGNPITLVESNGGLCGTFVSPSGNGAPPVVVAGNSRSQPFNLVVVTPCPYYNLAHFTYSMGNGEPVAQCEFYIQGVTGFVYSASNGCSVIAEQGFIDFIFPGTGDAKKRSISSHHRG